MNDLSQPIYYLYQNFDGQGNDHFSKERVLKSPYLMERLSRSGFLPSSNFDVYGAMIHGEPLYSREQYIAVYREIGVDFSFTVNYSRLAHAVVQYLNDAEQSGHLDNVAVRVVTEAFTTMGLMK